MKSLQYLNTHGQSSVTATDTRPAGVVFNRVAPLKPIDQLKTVTTTSVSVDPGIEILDIIQGATANVRYRVKIVTGGSPTLASTISFSPLPSGVTQTLVGSTYTLSGIDTVAKWNAVKSFTWNLAANWASCPLWYLEVSIIYYDGESAGDKTVNWLVYDERFYWISEMTSQFSLSANVLKAKTNGANPSASTALICSGDKVRNFQSQMSVQASVVAEGTIMVAILKANTTAACIPGFKFASSVALSTTVTINCTPTYTYTDDLRLQVYHDATRTTFTATVVTYQTNLIVYWGDGTNTSYTGTGDYRTHNISKTYTGTGYKDIKVAATAVTNFKPDRGAGKCYIYKIYNWSRVPAVANSYFSDSQYQGQIYLNEVPNYLPNNVTTMSGTFSGCTSLNDPNISSWNTSAMTLLTSVFDGCTSFNQPVSTWNVSNCNNFVQLFKGCSSFNQSLPWTFKSGANLSEMLKDCTGFNQDLTSMVIGGGSTTTPTTITMNEFLYGGTSFSTINYNKFLIRLANQVSSNTYGDGLGYPRGVTLGVPGNAVETNVNYGSITGQQAYNLLTSSPRSWTILKDGVAITCTSTSVAEGNIAMVTVSASFTRASFGDVVVNLGFGGTAVGKEYPVNSGGIYDADYIKFYTLSDLTTVVTSLTFNAAGTTSTNIYVRTLNTNFTHPKTLIVQLSSSHPNITTVSNGTITITGSP